MTNHEPAEPQPARIVNPPPLAHRDIVGLPYRSPWDRLRVVRSCGTPPRTVRVLPPAQAILYGMWMVPGVLGGLIIRKPGAAVLTSIAAAS